MTRAELSKLIEQSLCKDINLSEEEYKKKRLENDEQTKKNGYDGQASIKEPVRARRMAMNFYGTVLNILLNIHATNLEMLAEQKATNRLLSAILGCDSSEITNGEENKE
jgi:hypothetical protein